MDMKARIKSNGHIVNVNETGERVISKNGIERVYISDDCSGIYYSQSELEFLQTKNEDTIDWNQVRIQEAIAETQAFCNDKTLSCEKTSKMPVSQSDALVAELKKKGGQE
ncbi:hypothetical protein HMPREF9441_00542 [Paraprevotella clara YIT 11840]|uniref:Uncharacterized protein n=2 Tax=Paraprevotella clara TaxID=454154 RepID=G5SMG7_9BACT|nr:hypothetical protein HMPREF9441_00542 [Paraprevotella clara YIT 11840]